MKIVYCKYVLILIAFFIKFSKFNGSNLKIKSRSKITNQNNNKFSSRIKDDSNENKKPPLSLNITYTHPMHDIDEQRKYAEEHISFIRKTKEIETKINSDYENLKMLLNVQNIQIEKINEIFHTNLAVLYKKLADDYQDQYIRYNEIHGLNNKKEKNDTNKKNEKPVKVDFNDKNSIEDFKSLLINKGIVKPEYLNEDSLNSKVFFNVIKQKNN